MLLECVCVSKYWRVGQLGWHSLKQLFKDHGCWRCFRFDTELLRIPLEAQFPINWKRGRGWRSKPEVLWASPGRGTYPLLFLMLSF